MQHCIGNKIAVFGIALLFLLSTFVSVIGSSSRAINSDYSSNNSLEIISEDQAVVTCSTIGIGNKDTENKVSISQYKAEHLLEKIEIYSMLISQDPQSPEAQDMQEDIINLAIDYGLVPKETLSHVRKMRLPQQKILPKFRPKPMSSADEWFCNYAAGGEGGATPVIIFPRLTPILLFPIPRIFYRWNARTGFSSCGGMRSGTGFYAYGEQTGMALGFWGIGFSIFLPPIQAFGIIGYALYCRVEAQNLEMWPPNYVPEINAVYPLDEAQDVPIATQELSFHIDDPENELMSYSVTTSPDIGSGNGNLKTDGTYNINIYGLEGSEIYHWTVQVSDGPNTVSETYSFTTEPIAPIVSNPSPSDGETFVSINTTELQFHIRDPQGDLMDFTVETTPDIGSISRTGVSAGYYAVSISNLDHITTYRWYVNVTDGVNWKHKLYTFQTEPIMIFNPFNEGWIYRKNISLNPAKIMGDFTDFTVLISIIDSDLKNKAQIDGDDILFMDDVGVAHRLWHEIEYYDSTSGELICWVLLPQVLSGNENKFVMYYGNLSASNQQFPSQTWNDQYMGVWHLNDNPLNQIKDSTYNNNDGTAYGSMTSVNQALGKTGMALDFDGIDDYISVPDSPSLQPKDVTLSIWYKALSSDVGGYIVSKGSFDYWGNSDGHTYGFRNAETIRAVFEKDTNEQYEQIGSHIPVIEQWQHLLLSYDESTSTGRMFVDGVMIDEQTNCHSTVLWYYKPWNLLMGASKQGTGAGKTPTHFRNCILDEIRILDSALTEDWIQTEYENQNDPDSFYTIGSEEIRP